MENNQAGANYVLELLKQARGLGHLEVTPQVPPGDDVDPFVFVPSGLTLRSLEEFVHRDNPRQAIAAPRLQSAAAFVTYVNRFAQAENTVVFADVAAGAFEAVIDYHAPDKPHFGHHRATYSPAKSVQWATWSAGSKQPRSQYEFAEFIEGARSAIVGSTVPGMAKDLASLLEVTRSLQAKTEVNWSSGVRLKDGSTKLAYSEEVKGSTSNGSMEIPDGFELQIPIFYGGTPIRVACQFRYHMEKGGALKLSYVIHEKAEIEQQAFEEVVSEVKAGVTVPVIVGARQ